MRDDIINFSIKTNDATEDRSAVVTILDEGGLEIENIHVLQHGTVSKTVNVEKAGQLSKLIDANEKTSIRYLFVSGTLNNTDFTFIGNMTGLKYLDLSDITNTTLPEGKYVSPAMTAGLKGTYETIVFPRNLETIPDYCFAGTNLKGELVIPDGVKTIGNWAFCGCVHLNGNLVLGNAVTTIGENAFSSDKDNKSSRSLFASIYCKATIPPTISYKLGMGGYGGGAFYSYSSFGSPGLLANVYLYLNKGSKQEYLNAAWGKLFTSIEEVDFDKLGF